MLLRDRKRYAGLTHALQHSRTWLHGVSRRALRPAAARDRHGPAEPRAGSARSPRDPDAGRVGNRDLPRGLRDRPARGRPALRPLRPEAGHARRLVAVHALRARLRAQPHDRRVARLPPLSGRRRRVGRHPAARDHPRPVRGPRIAPAYCRGVARLQRRAADRPNDRRRDPRCRTVAPDLRRADGCRRRPDGCRLRPVRGVRKRATCAAISCQRPCWRATGRR